MMCGIVGGCFHIRRHTVRGRVLGPFIRALRQGGDRCGDTAGRCHASVPMREQSRASATRVPCTGCHGEVTGRGSATKPGRGNGAMCRMQHRGRGVLLERSGRGFPSHLSGRLSRYGGVRGAGSKAQVLLAGCVLRGGRSSGPGPDLRGDPLFKGCRIRASHRGRGCVGGSHAVHTASEQQQQQRVQRAAARLKEAAVPCPTLAHNALPHRRRRGGPGLAQTPREEVVNGMLSVHMYHVQHVLQGAAVACAELLPVGCARCFPRTPAVPRSPHGHTPRSRRG